MQTTNRLLMVRPVRFAFNEETAANNAFQQKSESEEAAWEIRQQAVKEFDSYVALLRENGITVEVLQDTAEPFTPDTIFPNNCFSTHIDDIPGKGRKERILVLYPMFAPNRQKERIKLQTVLGKMAFDKIIDLSGWEKENMFLEGTGSLILDRENRIAYACLSPRTNKIVVKEWAEQMDYDYFLFDSEDEHGVPVYHTNVMMHVGTRFAVVCLDSIKDIAQRKKLVGLLEKNGKKVVEITFEQMHQFAGNMLEIRNSLEEKLLVMSATAKKSLIPEQIRVLEQDVKIIAPDIRAIETTGGGSARCMIAEIF